MGVPSRKCIRALSSRGRAKGAKAAAGACFAGHREAGRQDVAGRRQARAAWAGNRMCAAAAACGCPIWRDACNARAKREGAMMSTTLTFTPMLGAYLDPSAIAIVVGGTAIGTVLRTPRRDQIGRAHV